ncbi:hypothetical protein HDU93_007423 [Gonapodya sp. JEL0774]|nr:hypothetical protein HDU93_007423 [Gonapodya sp. JEL0774]
MSRLTTLHWSKFLLPSDLCAGRSSSFLKVSKLVQRIAQHHTPECYTLRRTRGYCAAMGLATMLIVQPQFFYFFNSVAISQCFYYGRKWSLRASFGVFIAVLVGGLLMELAVYFGVKVARENNVDTAVNALGTIPIVFAMIGFLPQYWEFLSEWMATRIGTTTFRATSLDPPAISGLKRVIGISLIFSFIDGAGGLFNAISVVFRPPPLDSLAFLNFFSMTIAQTGTFLFYFWYEWVRSGRGTMQISEKYREEDTSVGVIGVESGVGDSSADALEPEVTKDFGKNAPT